MEVEVSVHPLQEKFDDAEEIMDIRPEEAIVSFRQIVDSDETGEELAKIKESAVYKLTQLYTKTGRNQDVAGLLKSVRPFFATIPKAKTAKIVRTVISLVAEIPDSINLQQQLCVDSIAWCRTEKRTFLRQRIESRLANIFFEQAKFTEALDLITRLLREVRKLDDKQLLLELFLTESRIHHALRNIPKAKAALTAARTASTSIYVVPRMQADMDRASGVVATEEKDYKVAFSYFLEAFEAFNSLSDPAALLNLQYMLMSKIMGGLSSDVYAIIHGKSGVKYAGPELEAMRAVAEASKHRSLKEFEAAMDKYKTELSSDRLISSQLSLLYEQLLEANLMKLIEPFSCVEIAHVAELIQLPLARIEHKLSQMILDHKLHGILEQGKGQLIIYDEVPEDQTYVGALGAVKNIDLVVDSLFRKANKLH